MGARREQDTGRRDALGRAIKVSGGDAQRAGESDVSGSSDSARGDFAVSPCEALEQLERMSREDYDPARDPHHVGYLGDDEEE